MPKHKPEGFSNSKIQFDCSLCGKNFSLKDTLRQHIKNVHEKKRPYKCEISFCNADFTKKRGLDKHMLTIHY